MKTEPQITDETNKLVPKLIPVKNSEELLLNWDMSVVDLYRNNGLFSAKDVRLRNCSLHYNNTTHEYYVRYKDVTFAIFDIYNIR